MDVDVSEVINVDLSKSLEPNPSTHQSEIITKSKKHCKCGSRDHARITSKHSLEQKKSVNYLFHCTVTSSTHRVVLAAVVVMKNSTVVEVFRTSLLFYLDILCLDYCNDWHSVQLSFAGHLMELGC